MAERSPREADDFGASADPALARLLRDLDALWGSPQPPAGLERAITRLARQPLPSRRFPPRRVMELAAAVVVVGLVAALVAALSVHDSPSAPATGSGQPALAAAPASPTPAATPTPFTSAAPGTIQALGDYGLTGRVDTYALPSGQLVLDLNVTGTSDVVDAVTWSLVPGTCAAWAAPGNAATTGQALYQFIAPVAGSTPHRIFRVTTPALNNTAPLALTAARSDSGEKAACADLRVEPYTARAIPPSAAPANCPVTRPPSPTFIPPSDYVAVPASSSEFWYGNAGLFVLLPADGSWVGLPYHDDAYFQKVFWGHQGYNWLTEQQPNITVTGRRLDAPAPPLEADRPTNAASPDMGSMMLTGVNFPTRGCWEVSGEYQGNTLSFVVWLGADTTPVGPSATPASTPIMGPPTPVVTAAPCHVGLMQLGVGNVSEPTGQHSLSLTLTNRSTQPCSLFGYPLISFFDAAGKQLPFDFQNSGDQVVTSKPPQLVVLAPGGAAYVTVNKYRCDAGEQGVAAGLRLGLPGDGTDPLAPLQADFSPDTMRMAYCGPGDPGSTVAVSPVAATFLATLNAH